ncbi:MAG: hypothetical protein HC884_19955 [Chloroflexaceae bacterium]|nr:hypothetical protein [Chloroflexaceae bacterium]
MTDAVSHWYVVHCRPFREKQAAIAIQETLGLTVYLPKFQQCIHGQPQWALLFPRYLLSGPISGKRPQGVSTPYRGSSGWWGLTPAPNPSRQP